MKNVRPDYIISTGEDDCDDLHVQIDADQQTCKFTIIFALQKGEPPHVALKRMARFITTNTQPKAKISDSDHEE